MRRWSCILGGRNEGGEWGEAGDVSPGGWRPSQTALVEPICPTLNLGPQLSGLWICFVLFHLSRFLPHVQGEKVCCFLKFPDHLPLSTLHKSKPQWRFLLHRLYTRGSEQLTPINRPPRPRRRTLWEIYTLINRQAANMFTGRGSFSQMQTRYAAVKGEIVQSYLPSTDQGGIPKTKLT